MTIAMLKSVRWLYSTILLFTSLVLANQALAAPVITNPLSGSTLPSVAIGEYMSITINSSGGILPLDQWAECDISAPDYKEVTPCLPNGLTLNPSYGSSSTILHGAPTTAGTYTFSISLNDGQNQAAVATYTLQVVPATLTNASPNTGTTAGGTTVTLTGNHLTGASTVSFGNTPATNFTVNSATSITATAPAHAEGTVNIVVTTPTGPINLPNSYTYTSATPTVSPVNATVTANSSANSIGLALGGGAATSVTVHSAPSHGSTTTSGTGITYTPTAGYSGLDSFTYTATNSSGTSTPATVTITVTPATLAINPVSLSGGIGGSAYSQTLSATNGSAPYTYTITAGSLPAGLSLSSTGVLSGTPSANGSFNFTVSAEDTYGATGSRAYTLQIVVAPPTASAVNSTVMANTSNNTINLILGGGAATSVAVGSSPSHGTATVSGTDITYTPTAGYSGLDSFTYTATNSSGTSTPATVTITVIPATLAITPGSLTNGTAGSVYSQALSATNGTAPYTYAITGGSLPAGLTLSPAGLLSGTPSADGSLNFTVSVQDTYGAIGSQAYTLQIAVQAPSANAVSSTVAANTSNNQINLALGGGAATSVTVDTNPSHGTATASGIDIIYTPTAGYSGPDSFTYTATNASGTSAAATVTIIVTAPTLNIGPSSLANGIVGSAYSQALGASNGMAPYTYAITGGSLPAGLTLSPAGLLSGTPSADGSLNFTVSVQDTYGAIGSQAYTLQIAVQAPSANAVSSTVAANTSNNQINLALGGGAATSVTVDTNPSHGTATASGIDIIYTPTAGYSGPDSFTYTATNASGTSAAATVTIIVTAPTLNIGPSSLANGIVGSAYSQALGASNGMAPYTYAITGGSLPAGLSLSPAGILSGTPSADGSFNFSLSATDANNASGTQAYTITISAQAIHLAPADQILVPGQAATVDLTQGATGGPFTRAMLGSVSPSSAGSVQMVGPFSLRFIPSATFAGTAFISFSLHNGSGASANGSLRVIVQPRSDPSKDAEVIGLLNAQNRAAERFANTQMDNVNRRLEQLHQMACERNSFKASLTQQGDNIPLGAIANAVQEELNGTAALSKQQRRAAASETAEDCQEQKLGFWSDGFINSGSTHLRGASDSSFTTVGLSAGVDYRLFPSLIAGLGIGYGNDRSDIGNHDTRSDADAIAITSYLSWNPASQFFVDALLGYNRISFDSRRYITGSDNDYARGSRDADQLFASLTGSYEYRNGHWSLTPYGRLNASVTRLDDSREKGGGIYALSYDEQRLQNLTSFLGVRSSYDFVTPVGLLTPKVGLAWGHNFRDSSDFKMRYADQGDLGSLYRLTPDAQDSDFADLDLGLSLSLGRTWQLDFSYKTALGEDERNDMFRLGLNADF